MIIADVDCTAPEGESVCSNHDVSGYPTIKYFTSETGPKGADYDGGRSQQELVDFVAEKLARKCNVETKEDCDEKSKEYIDKQFSKSVDDLDKELMRLNSMKDDAMKPDKKEWLLKRVGLLSEMEKAKKKGGKGEL